MLDHLFSSLYAYKTRALVMLCFRHQAPSVVNGALEAVGNIVTGDEEQVQVWRLEFIGFVILWRSIVRR